MMAEPWTTLVLGIVGMAGVFAAAFTQDWLAERAERRRRSAEG
jgi:uncharacterized membrane protein YuzA (DUF378 family)